MKEYLKKLPKEVLELIYLAGGICAKKDMPAYLVGGCVRDLFLGRGHFDLDIVVEGDAISFADEFGRRLGSKVIRHRRFGTATVFVKRQGGDSPFSSPSKTQAGTVPLVRVDFATSRKEDYPHPAALPEVTPSSLKDDLFRRDFTINAMAIDITPGNFGALVDFFGGRSDLAKGIIRMMHDKSFIDDPTRILRAIRFEQRLGFRIEGRTLRQIREAVRKNMFAHLKPSRISRELKLIIGEDNAQACLRRVNQLCGFKIDAKGEILRSRDHRDP